VVDLHPDRGATRVDGVGPGRELTQVAVVVEDDVAGFDQPVAVDHDVAGDEEPGAGVGPGGVEAAQLVGGGAVAGGELFAHAGFDDAVGQHGAAGQFQLVGQVRGHASLR
jgi:hypothetical protein